MNYSLAWTVFAIAAVALRTPYPNHLPVSKQQRADSAIVEKYWKLVTMNDLPVVSRDERQSEPHMILKTFRSEVRGNGGCNSFTATYKLFGADSIAVTNLIAKEETCKNISSERRFFKFLAKTSNYRVDEDTLYMQDATGKLTARFEAIYLK